MPWEVLQDAGDALPLRLLRSADMPASAQTGGNASRLLCRASSLNRADIALPRCTPGRLLGFAGHALDGADPGFSRVARVAAIRRTRLTVRLGMSLQRAVWGLWVTGPDAISVDCRSFTG